MAIIRINEIVCVFINSKFWKTQKLERICFLSKKETLNNVKSTDGSLLSSSNLLYTSLHVQILLQISRSLEYKKIGGKVARLCTVKYRKANKSYWVQQFLLRNVLFSKNLTFLRSLERIFSKKNFNYFNWQ